MCHLRRFDPGLCNAGVGQLKIAREIVPIVSVQNKYNLWHRMAEKERTGTFLKSYKITALPPWNIVRNRKETSTRLNGRVWLNSRKLGPYKLPSYLSYSILLATHDTYPTFV